MICTGFLPGSYRDQISFEPIILPSTSIESRSPLSQTSECPYNTHTARWGEANHTLICCHLAKRAEDNALKIEMINVR